MAASHEDTTKDTTKFEDEEKELIAELRGEAEAVKDCFTKYSFQSVGLSAAAYGIILRVQQDAPLASLASLLMILLLLSVVRIGIHKYETANRHYGYQLHLERRRFFVASDPGWSPEMRKIGWEQAIYAWRVIEPQLYRKLYVKSPFIIPTLRTALFGDARSWVRPIPTDSVTRFDTFNFFMRIIRLVPKWRKFIDENQGNKTEENQGKKAKCTEEPASNANEDQDCEICLDYPFFEAGSYLKKTFNILHIFCFAGVGVMIIALLSALMKENSDVLLFEKIVLIFAIPLSIFAILVRMYRIVIKREILESEFGSINTSAIIWYAVVVAHHRAFKALESDGQARVDFQGYTKKLLDERDKICGHAENIYAYIRENNEGAGVGARET